MKALLIAPPLYVRNKKKIFPRFPPYIVLSVAAQLTKEGFDVQVFDAYLEYATLEQIKEAVKLYAPSFIGIAPADVTRFPPIEVDIELTRLLKKSFPAIPIVIFGLKDRNNLWELLKNVPDIDYVILGDPEELMVKLACSINVKAKLENTAGLIASPFSQAKLDSAQPQIVENLDRLAFPAWYLINLNRYYFFPHRYKTDRLYPVTATRGCPWNRCIFCKDLSIANSSPYRSRSPGHLAEEIEYAVNKLGKKEIQFFDSNFNTDIDWLNKFREELKKRKVSFIWTCLSRVDRLNKEPVALMHEMGCWNIVFGLESSSQRLLDVIDKGCSLGQIREAVDLCKNYGILTTGNFLIGLPYEQPDDVLNSAKFAVDIGLDYAAFFIAKWHDEHRQFESEGRLLKEWDYSQFDFRGSVFIPKSYKGLAHLKKIQRKAYLTFYSHPRVVSKHLMGIRSLKDLKRLFLAFLTLIKMHLEKIKAF